MNIARLKSTIALAIGSLVVGHVAVGQGASQGSNVAHQPNIVLVVLDDAGYTDLGAYGGEIKTPHIDELARNGVLFSQFHVTPNCSTTRASLLTGMDHHRTGLGTHEGSTENQRGKPGYEGFLNRRVMTLPEVMRTAGYRTIMAGKWHLGAKSPKQWPSARGFDDSFALFYGTDQWQLYDLNSDPGEMNDLATEYPKQLRTLVQHWQSYATENGVVEPNKRISYAKPPVKNERRP